MGVNKSLFSFLFIFSVEMFCQQRQFLQNEATSQQMKIKNNNSSFFVESQGFKQQNFGNSQVFIQVIDKGYFSIEFSGQMIETNTGKFLFFDVQNHFQPIKIYQNNYLIYQTLLKIVPNSRLNLSFELKNGLFLDFVESLNVNSVNFNHQGEPIFIISDYEFESLIKNLEIHTSYDRYIDDFLKQPIKLF